MSNTKAVLRWLFDSQARLVSWIAENGACTESHGQGIWVRCDGEGRYFYGTLCPLKMDTANACSYAIPEERITAAKEWINEYHRLKADGVEYKESK